MKLSWHMLGQVVLMLIQLLNAVSTTVSPKWQPVVAGGIALGQLTLAYIAHHYTPDGTKISTIILAICLYLQLGVLPTKAQNAQQPSAFPTTTVTFNLSPVTLPGARTAVAGAETDAKLKITQNVNIGETTLIGGNYSFIGGRGDYVIPQFSRWLQNASTTLNGYQFQLGVTGSLGVIRTPSLTNIGQSQSHWGQRFGVFLNYSLSGNTGLGLETQWCNFPGYAHNTYSIAFGPNFHF